MPRGRIHARLEAAERALQKTKEQTAWQQWVAEFKAEHVRFNAAIEADDLDSFYSTYTGPPECLERLKAFMEVCADQEAWEEEEARQCHAVG